MIAATKKKNVNAELYRKLLLQKREDLVKRLYEGGSKIARDETEGTFAWREPGKDLTIANVERELRLLAEVELSLRLLESGQYGLCGSCGDEIATARLQALPWARICVACAGGGIHRAVKESNRLPTDREHA
jgi:DnaK suppressor protein